MDFLPTWASDLSGWGAFVTLALFVVWQIVTGRLVTRRELDASNARGDKFQHAWELSMKAREEDARQKGELMENSRTTARVMGAIQQERAQRAPLPGDPEVAS